MKLSLGPIQYYWSVKDTHEFYAAAIDSPVDIIYLGESVCSKRRNLKAADWLEIAEQVEAAGKQAVISTLTLIEAASELSTMRRYCDEARFLVEANEQGAIERLSAQNKPFVTGPSVNIYNPRTLQLLAKSGLKRWVFPLELSRDTLASMQRSRPDGVETEVFAWGRMPLAHAARCFTARSLNLPKDDCQLSCIDYPDGLLMKTQEKENFLCINGIQTQSAKTCNLINEIAELQSLNVDVLRISPQANHTFKIVDAFYGAIETGEVEKSLDPLASSGSCNGYWHGEAGMQNIPA